MDIQEVIKVREGMRCDVRHCGESRVVDEDIDSAVTVHRLPDQRSGHGRICDGPLVGNGGATR